MLTQRMDAAPWALTTAEGSPSANMKCCRTRQGLGHASVNTCMKIEDEDAAKTLEQLKASFGPITEVRKDERGREQHVSTPSAATAQHALQFGFGTSLGKNLLYSWAQVDVRPLAKGAEAEVQAFVGKDLGHARRT